MTDGQGMDDGRLRIRIIPEPTDEEAAAVVAVMGTLAAAMRAPQASPGVPEDRWRVAGRREAMRSSEWPAPDIDAW